MKLFRIVDEWVRSLSPGEWWGLVLAGGIFGGIALAWTWRYLGG